MHPHVIITTLFVVVSIATAGAAPTEPFDAALAMSSSVSSPLMVTPLIKQESCAEQCASEFMTLYATHPELTAKEQKEESLKCIHKCRSGGTS
ncbi:hypothetical protein Y032_0027g1504 [Ancylostoma ceylanicum]|uniref:Uncharacterized protein n=1 Tax=Ancylostoma ceylanicum TaxID=53326 RepID=A0A016USK2_9BILA|nr:hypothetical protein Y032_0027g1504 [Ancylostoma ceylanicum]